MKTIRLRELAEIEVYNISDISDRLVIEILNTGADVSGTELPDAGKLLILRNYAEKKMRKDYFGYNILQGYCRQSGRTVNIDYNIKDPTTLSGFREEKADILTLTLVKQNRNRGFGAQRW